MSGQGNVSRSSRGGFRPDAARQLVCPHAAQQSCRRRGTRRKVAYPTNQATVVHKQSQPCDLSILRVLHRELQLRTYTARSWQPSAPSGPAGSQLTAAEPLCKRDRGELVVLRYFVAAASEKLCSVLGFRRELSKELAKLACGGDGEKVVPLSLGSGIWSWSVRHCQQGPAGVVTSLLRRLGAAGGTVYFGALEQCRCHFVWIRSLCVFEQDTKAVLMKEEKEFE